MKDNAKECAKYHTITLISHASKVMLKILQVRLQQYMDQELPDVQAGFRKGRGTKLAENQIGNIHWIIEKQGDTRKTSTSASQTMLKLGLRKLQQTVENSSRDKNTRPLDLSPEKSVCRSRSNS